MELQPRRSGQSPPGGLRSASDTARSAPRRRESENPLALVDRLVAEPADGSLKLYVTRCALRFRREHRALFAKGSYLPLRAAGEKNKHVIAFARSFRGTTVLVLAGRFFAQLGADARVLLGADPWGGGGSRPP